MNKDRIQYLLHLYLDDSCTAAELDELKSWLMNPDHEAHFNDFLDEVWDEIAQEDLIDINREKADILFGQITTAPQKSRSTRRLWPRLAAAVLLISVSAGLFFYMGHNKKIIPLNAVEQAGTKGETSKSNQPTLTLADGSVISLSEAKAGVLVDGNKLVYTDGSTVINGEPEEEDAEERYAELSTPAGAEYQIVLSDGTKVWLNASSKLRYPSRFSKKDRIVELEGEGYFDVSKSKDHPFIVRSKGQEVKVLGTQFNIAAYEDDDVIKTTLVHGSVQVNKTEGKNQLTSLVLTPGEQSTLRSDSRIIEVNEVNVNEVTDWKEGLFLFNNEPIKSIMKRVARWYNVDVVYRGNMDNIRFVGSYSRSKNLKNLLKNIELTGKVVFKIEGGSKGTERRIIVINNY